MIQSNIYADPTLSMAPSAIARQGRVIRSAGRRIIPESVPANSDLAKLPSCHSVPRNLISMVVTGLCIGGLSSVMLFLPSGEPYRKHSSKLLSSIAGRLNEQLVDGSSSGYRNPAVAHLKRATVEPVRSYQKLTLIPPVEPPTLPAEVLADQTREHSVTLASFSVSTRSVDRQAIEPRVPEQPKISQRDVVINSSAHLHTHRSAVSRVFSIIRKYAPKNQNPHVLAEAIVRESRNQTYDPLFVAAVIKAESTFNSQARSHRGAQGLMQIMPATGAWIAHKEDLPRGKLTDPGHNLKLGITYLKHLDKQFEGNKVFTLVAYNWGPGHLQKAAGGQKRIPRECLSYALKILNDYKRWQSGLI